MLKVARAATRATAKRAAQVQAVTQVDARAPAALLRQLAKEERVPMVAEPVMAARTAAPRVGAKVAARAKRVMAAGFVRPR